MGGVYARAVVTKMIQLKRCRDFAMRHFVSDAVSLVLLSAQDVVSIPPSKLPSPLPAPLRFFNFRPKSLRVTIRGVPLASPHSRVSVKIGQWLAFDVSKVGTRSLGGFSLAAASTFAKSVRYSLHRQPPVQVVRAGEVPASSGFPTFYLLIAFSPARVSNAEVLQDGAAPRSVVRGEAVLDLVPIARGEGMRLFHVVRDKEAQLYPIRRTYVSGAWFGEHLCHVLLLIYAEDGASLFVHRTRVAPFDSPVRDVTLS